MLEVVLLALLVLFLPLLPFKIVWVAVAFMLVLPGLYATWSGAPYVPSSKKFMRRMLELADIKPGEQVYDLGCGDGRLIFAAAKQGAQAIGYEFSFPTFLVAYARSLFVAGARIRCRNFWHGDYRSADVIFCYLLTDSMQTFKKKIWPQLKPGCRVVSHAFRMNGVEARYDKEGVVLYVK